MKKNKQLVGLGLCQVAYIKKSVSCEQLLSLAGLFFDAPGIYVHNLTRIISKKLAPNDSQELTKNKQTI